MRIVLGVGGGIAAYKAASLLRLFTEAGHNVTVVPTESSKQFVGVATWEALSGNPVSSSVFDEVEKVNHVRLGHEADLIVVAPATADLLARAAGGQANDLLTNTLLMARGPVVFAPAMHTEMWTHPATAANVATLRSRGAVVLEPGIGRLTGKDTGPGRLPEPEAIFAAALAAVDDGAAEATRVLTGSTVTITAGGTREPLDPVRFLGNRSSGKQGTALAEAALAAGARVRLIAAHMDVPAPRGVELVRVETALELRAAAHAAAADSDVVIMAAAVADFRPSEVVDTKIKKRDDEADPVITLVRNPDILQELVHARDTAGTGIPKLIVGFAAETGDANGDVLEYGRKKLARKGCDLLVLNRVGTSLVFGQDETEVRILSPADSGQEAVESVAGTKADVSARIVARIAAELAARSD
ncbi:MULTISPECIES: bifunctional phosphopantothenoylcysteine decarboxylase/phosphopantothenate--cysteine ligase CoaBC [unclassified Arthrobacter]|uniref:bifunctional phosphopantothenoylcysteine decarboxylase/phosphopantothenate--cysteine ligase CoaBC n=1 Tax=unclassified Arthrobacter TaxID=235627 RepID=UPI0024DFC55B|nr:MULTISPECIES: bifunctional phosphopantothenoylcysteine decarboxylase/phosphopantothenate--cysteine ligase CoaBC [unclassified Arthrobacter]MCC9145522.1 bifunctional phosphopantothenoylcysteine decarboxylase/phosphopantothenate--cysteine ligase CoaBC [Arthrobacter sp. zg-Y919]MDK1276751.1 bifunctional phosphopantothenoylcysteine decarboxylase/phosphopantothenate--cysteine ligase CoaBC [Arthrobacter sp. zg.Y919]WIB04306.1 bifunctional phosphopantothenoylcysteine decarboxylase/phosphopantothenat